MSNNEDFDFTLRCVHRLVLVEITSNPKEKDRNSKPKAKGKLKKGTLDAEEV